MRFYTQQHRYYCGIDLHARRMYICVLDAAGKVRVHRNGPARPEHFLKTIAPYREDVNVEAQRNTPTSLLNTMKRLIRARKTSLGRGTIDFLRPRTQRCSPTSAGTGATRS